MKIAICLSGDLINWRSTFITIYDLTKMLKDNFDNVSIDIFCHFWENQNIKELLSRIDCKNYIIDSIEKSKNRNELIDYKIKFNFLGNFDKCILSDYASDYYSMKISSYLKKEYEIDNNFQYDVCFKLSYNIELFQIYNIIIDKIKNIEYRNVFSINKKVSFFTKVSTSTDFFFTDSITFDLLTSFYDALPIINLNIFHDGFDNGTVFYYYIKMFNLINVPLSYTETNKLI